MEKLIETILQAGGHWGLIVAALVWTIRELDRRNAKMQEAHTLALAQAQANERTEHEKRLEDQKVATRALLEMADRTHQALDKVADVIDVVRQAPAQPYRVKPIGMK